METYTRAVGRMARQMVSEYSLTSQEVCMKAIGKMTFSTDSDQSPGTTTPSSTLATFNKGRRQVWENLSLRGDSTRESSLMGSFRVKASTFSQIRVKFTRESSRIT
jgi:hypothetical protein